MATEKRLIDANALREAVITDYYEHFTQCHDTDQIALIDMVCEDIDESPAVDAVEVVHSYWKETAYVGVSRCSCCDKPSSTPDCLKVFYNYCPNCGAKMDGERKDKNENESDA